MNIKADTRPLAVPFDHEKLDRLMEAAGIDVLLATSKHNVQYMLGGYKFIFFAAMDAIGHSRYLPILVYEKGRPDHAAYIGNKMEGSEHANRPFWTPSVHPAAWGTVDAARIAAEHIGKIAKPGARIGIEPPFMPSDAHAVLEQLGNSAQLVDATSVFERLRAVKMPEELEKLRAASELITDSMLATIEWAREGTSKAEIIERLRREETKRGLHFEYCLLTLGSSHNRAVSPQSWQAGEVLSIDSGGNYHGYIGDLCRMGVLGEPDAELEDLLSEIDTVQQAAFSKVRAGTLGGDVISHAEGVLKASPSAAFTDFFAHGMGLITHEVPFLMTDHPVAYEGVDAAHALEEGMVLSVETTMLHPTRGFIKLEDTLAVTGSGYEMFGERGRGGTAAGADARFISRAVENCAPNRYLSGDNACWARMSRTSLTRNQTKVLERLEAASGPLSAYTLLDQLRSDGFRAPLQVYRALDGLMDAGFVHRLESMNAFVACSDPHDHGHEHGHSHGMTAFAICDKCGQVAEFCDEAVGHRLDSWVAASGFVASKAVIEFRGVCAKCAGSA